MACLECGLEQAVTDTGACARCGAPLADTGHPPGTFTRLDGAELELDSRGITTAGWGRDARARLLPWDEIGWFRDGWHAPESGKPGWVLQVVMADGRVEAVTETWTAGIAKATPDMLSLIRRAAAAHSVPAVLTGERVPDGLPGEDQFRLRNAHTATLYHDPAGEPGLREWTGAGWSPYLHVDPGASGHSDRENGLARIWSPLSAAELQRQSNALLRGLGISTAILIVIGGGMALLLTSIAMRSASHHGTDLAGGAAALFFLACCGFGAWSVWTQKRIALALSAAATRASAQDDPPASTAPPDLRTH
jgi:hypothetical protein